MREMGACTDALREMGACPYPAGAHTEVAMSALYHSAADPFLL